MYSIQVKQSSEDPIYKYTLGWTESMLFATKIAEDNSATISSQCYLKDPGSKSNHSVRVSS